MLDRRLHFDGVSTCCVLLAVALSLPAQNKSAWPPIPPEELTMKDHPGNPGAHAIILYRESHTDDEKGFERIYYRVKVFTEEGKKYADIQIPYAEKFNRIEDIAACTVRPDGTTVEFQGQIFDKVLVKARKLRVQAKTFTLPGVQAGTIIQYSYTRRWRDKLPDPLRNPSNYIITGMQSFPTARWVIPDELFTRRAIFSIRPLPKGNIRWSWMGLPKDVKPVQQPDGTIQLVVENVPAFEEEENMPPEDMLKGRVDLFYLLGYVPSTESFWREQGKQLAERFDKFIGKSKRIEQEVARTIDPADPPETKLRKLYARVEQIRYLNYERARTEKEEKRENLKDNHSAEDLLNRGYGRGNEINFLFAALCRAAGFEAWIVELVARDRGFFFQNILDPSQLNAIVVAVRVGSEWRYFDPATRFCPFNLLPWAETGTKGIRLEMNSGYFVTTPSPKSSDAVIERKATLRLDDAGSLQGRLQVSYTGHPALRRRLDALEMDDAGRRKGLEEEVKGWLPGDATVKLESVSGWEGSEDPLRAEFTVQVPSLGVSTGRRLLLPLGVFRTNRKYPLQNAKRTHPVYFSYPFQEIDDVTLTLPEGRQVASLPAPQKTTPDFGQYETSCAGQGRTLRLQRRLVLEGFYFSLNHYASLRAFFERVRAGDEQQIVLQTLAADERK